MQLHTDVLKRVVVDSTRCAWEPSPAHGIERRLLERDGDEIARATSVVRYLPGSHFPLHLHGRGEEIYVLEGEFRDEHGHYAAGTWIKNPPGSSHAPFTDYGCQLLVKLRHLDPDDLERQVLTPSDRQWQQAGAPGLAQCTLGHFHQTRTWLLRLAPGATQPQHVHEGGEELFVLEGSCEDAAGHYGTGTWIRNPHGSAHALTSATGCLLYVKDGHLPPPG